MIRIGEQINNSGHNGVLLNRAERVENEQRRDHEEEEEIRGQKQIGDLLVAQRSLAECFASVAVHSPIRVDYLAYDDDRAYEHDERWKHDVEEDIHPINILNIYI